MTVVTKKYNGMDFRDLHVSVPVKLEAAIDRYEKIVVERPLTLQIHQKAYKYSPELLLSQWSFDYPTPEPRGVIASQYWRTEIILSELQDLNKVHELRDFFLDCVNVCDCVLKGIKV